jgi:hypothetical protein
MRKLLLTTALAIALPAAANATLLTAFAQESSSNTVTATDSAGVTTISYTNALTTLGGGILGAIPGAVMTLTATSIDAAISVAGNVIQHYNGSFCISAAAGCTGNFLSGVFTDAAFGALGGPGLTVNVNNPPESLTLASNVIPANELVPPNSFNLAFVSLSNPLAIVGGSIGSFTAAFSGDISASASAVPEPASIAILGIGLLGLTMLRRKSS